MIRDASKRRVAIRSAKRSVGIDLQLAILFFGLERDLSGRLVQQFLRVRLIGAHRGQLNLLPVVADHVNGPEYCRRPPSSGAGNVR